MADDALKLTVQLDQDSINQVMARLGILGSDVPRKTFVGAARDAMKVLMERARTEAPIKTGALKKSQGVRVKTYASSKVIYAIAGDRKGASYEYGATGRLRKAKGKGPIQPWRYAHLVEFGHKNRVAMKPLEGTHGYYPVKKNVSASSYTPGRYFMTKSFSATASQIVLRFLEDVKKGVDAACRGQKPAEEGATA